MEFDNAIFAHTTARHFGDFLTCSVLNSTLTHPMLLEVVFELILKARLACFGCDELILTDTFYIDVFFLRFSILVSTGFDPEEEGDAYT